MPKMYPIQSSFAAGEVASSMYGRFDTPGYQQGLLECTNAFVDSRGPVKRRPGFQFAGSVVAQDARIFNFDYSRNDPFLIVFTNLEVRVASPNSGGLGPELLFNSSFPNDGVLTPWADLSTGNGDVTVAGGSCELDPDKQAAPANSAMISQSVTVTPGTFVFRMAGDFTGPAGTQWEVRLGSTPGGNEYATDLLPTGGTFFEREYPGLSAGLVYISIYAPGWGVGGNPDTSGKIDDTSFKEKTAAIPDTTLPAPYSDAEVAALRGQMSPDGLYMVITHPNYAPWVLIFGPAGPSWVFQEWTITAAPIEWAGVNFPTTMTFHEGRSWWGGCIDNPETLWGSQSAVYWDLTIGVDPDDGLKFTIAEHGQIMWIEAGKDLLVGTALREFIITSVDGVITPGDIKVEQQSAYGSAPLQPELMGNELLFVSAINIKVRSMWYQWTESGYLARDLSYTNNQITNPGIRHMDYMRDPNQYIWFCTSAGELIGCTYHKDGNDKPIYGWHRHRITEGLVLDTAVLYKGNRTDIVLAVRVNVNGEDQVHLQVASFEPQGAFNPGLGPNTQAFQETTNIVFLDDYKSIQLASEQTVVPGLEHLEGKTVTPVVDGAVQTDKVVVGGEITLDYPGNQVQVGLSYTSKVVTLPQVTPAQGGGSTASYAKGRNKIYARMLNSALPKINGHRGAERHPSTPMNLGEPVFSGDIFVTDLGWTELGSVIFEQDLPYPMNINMIFGEMALETL